jgi:hypothetical protein
MVDDKQVATLVRAMVARHGHMAPQAAVERVLHWAMAGDQMTALLWFAVAETTATMMARSNSGLSRMQ